MPESSSTSIWSHFRKTDDPASFRRLFGLTRKYRGRMVIAALSLFLAGAIQLTFPAVLRFMIDSALVQKSSQMLNRAVIILAAVMLVGAVVQFINQYQVAYIGERIVTDLRKKLFQHLQTLSLSFYDDRKTGEIMSHVTNDTTLIQASLSTHLLVLPQSLVTLVAGTVIVLAVNWRLALYVLCISPFILLTSVILSRPVRRLSTQAQEELGIATTVLEETLTAQRIVKAFAREAFEENRFGRAIEKMFGTSLQRIRYSALLEAAMRFFVILAVSGLFWYGSHEVLANRLTPGGLVAFIVYMMLLIQPLATLFSLYSRFQQALGAGARIFSLLDIRPSIEDHPDAYALPPIEGHIEVANVTFSYLSNGESGHVILNNVSLRAQPGETVAIVGPSGAGKTTLVNLIPRFYEPQTGSITIDGHNVFAVTQNSLRNALAIVPQEATLFSGTVRDNIAYGKLDATIGEIESAARTANAHEFISRLTNGYDTMVGERGVKLSGGQRQRIAIARALLKDPRVLILDEATSSLDNESEKLVQEALDRLMKGRTTLVIAHRLTTIERADRIVVLDEGGIVESGTHSELLKKNGLYYRLYTRDFRDEGSAPPEALAKSTSAQD